MAFDPSKVGCGCAAFEEVSGSFEEVGVFYVDPADILPGVPALHEVKDQSWKFASR